MFNDVIKSHHTEKKLNFRFNEIQKKNIRTKI